MTCCDASTAKRCTRASKPSARPRSVFVARMPRKPPACGRTVGAPQRSVDSAPRSTSCGRSRISRTSRISPKTSTESAAGARTRSPDRSRSRAASLPPWRISPKPACAADALAAWFAEALVSPVLTAHPTEVQRKSILDCEREIARLMMWRDRSVLTPDEGAEWETDVYRQIVALWQTAMLRLSRLQVRDEIENGLAYYRYTFLTRDAAAVRGACCASCNAYFGADIEVPPFLRMGSWIGGDRDGNPFVVARNARIRDSCAGGGRVRPLPRRGSPAWRRTVAVGAPGAADAGADGSWSRPPRDANPHRQDEPYRQALTGNLCAARRDVDCACRARRPRARPMPSCGPYGTPLELAGAISRSIRASLATHGAAILATRRLTPLIRAVAAFGFHLASIDLRQNADVHEAVVGELLARAGVVPDYCGAAGGRAGRAADARAAHAAAARTRRILSMASARVRSSRSSPRRPTIHRGTAPQAVPNYVISSARRCPTCSKSACC